ncbi:ATP-binding protein [Elusimicrobiota bacterium]
MYTGKKLLILVGVSILCFLGITISINVFTNKQLSLIERYQENYESENFSEFIEIESETLYDYIDEYSAWDEVINFAKDPKKGIDEIDFALAEYGIDFVWIYDSKFKPIFTEGLADPADFKYLPLKKRDLKNAYSENYPIHFYFYDDEDLVEMHGASLMPENAGHDYDPIGYMFVGRFIINEYIANVSQWPTTHVSIYPEDEKISEEDEEYVVAEKELLDWEEEPIAIIRYFDYTVMEQVEDSLTLLAFIYMISVAAAFIILFFLSLHWILKHRATEKSLGESEERFKLFMGNISGFVFIKDNECRFLLASSQAKKIFDARTDQLTGKTNNDIWPSDIAGEITRNDVKTLSLKKGEHLETRETIDIDGKIKPFVTYRFLIPRKDGNHLIGGIALDISDKAKAEEQYRKLSLVIDHVTSAVLITDAGGGIEYANSAFTNMSGYSMVDIAGKTPRLWQTSEEFKNKYASLWDAIKSGNEWKGELVNGKKDGQFYWTYTVAYPVKNNENVLSNYLFIEEDITKTKTVQDKPLQESPCEFSPNEKAEFLATIGYELREPVQLIISTSDSLLNTTLDDKQKEYVKKFKETCDSLIDSLDGMINTAKTEAGGTILDYRPIDVKDILDEVVETFTDTVKEKNIEIELDIKKGLNRSVIGDGNRLRQVFFNLVSNSIKFTKEGKISIHAENEKDENENVFILFSVTDTGIGIQEDELKTIFDNFTSLVISKRLVALMGGKIWAESTPGKGSKFFFTAKFKKGDKK